MDHTNHWYGHAHILAEYCGLSPESPPPVRGMIQHGWTFVHGFGYAHVTDWSLAKYVWSDVCRRRGEAIGWRNYFVIGAPFLYLMQLLADPGEEREGTIWYPFHGTKDYESVQGSHHELIEEIRDTEDGPVTMCLYYVEYEDPETRRLYEDAGFRVITHGHRGSQWQGTDRFFLHRQLAEQRRHRRVASNRLTTAVMYGIAAGCEPAVYGDPMDFVGVKAGFNGAGLLEAHYPELFGKDIDVQRAREIAHRELGADFLASPDELRYVLGWQEPWLESSN